MKWLMSSKKHKHKSNGIQYFIRTSHFELSCCMEDLKVAYHDKAQEAYNYELCFFRT